LGKSIREIETTFSRNELEEWSAYFAVEPFNSVEIQLALMAHLKALSSGSETSTINDMLITGYKPPVEEVKTPLFANDDSVKSALSILASSN